MHYKVADSWFVQRHPDMKQKILHWEARERFFMLAHAQPFFVLTSKVIKWELALKMSTKEENVGNRIAVRLYVAIHMANVYKMLTSQTGFLF